MHGGRSTDFLVCPACVAEIRPQFEDIATFISDSVLFLPQTTKAIFKFAQFRASRSINTWTEKYQMFVLFSFLLAVTARTFGFLVSFILVSWLQGVRVTALTYRSGSTKIVR